MDLDFNRVLVNKSGIPFRKIKTLSSPGGFADTLMGWAPDNIKVQNGSWADVLPVGGYDVIVCLDPKAPYHFKNTVEFHEKMAASTTDYLVIDTLMPPLLAKRMYGYYGVENIKHLHDTLYIMRKRSLIDVVGSKTQREGDYHVTTFLSEQDYVSFSMMYKDICGLPGVPKIDFLGNRQCRTPHMGDGRFDQLMIDLVVNGVPLPEDLRLNLREQLIAFVHAMNRAGYVHRDLNPKNLVFDGNGKLTVIDWDCLAPSRTPIRRSYDLTGQSMNSPKQTGHMHLLKNIHHMGRDFPSVGEVLGFTLEDFHETVPVLL